MSDRWVNAVIEVTVPLDVELSASAGVKRDAVAQALEELWLPRNAVACGRWQVVEDGEPVDLG